MEALKIHVLLSKPKDPTVNRCTRRRPGSSHQSLIRANQEEVSAAIVRATEAETIVSGQAMVEATAEVVAIRESFQRCILGDEALRRE